MNANEINREFISLLREAGKTNDFIVNIFWSTRREGQNILQLSGAINCLLYFKVISKKPYRWGVTANRIDELRQSNRKWFIVLLYESPNTGYLITADDVMRYLDIWALGNDGDYKVGPGSYLQYNKPFNSFYEFINSLTNHSC